MTVMKHLSAIANDVVQRCALELKTSVDKLVEEFEAGWKPETSNYSRKLVEFCCSKALHYICTNIEAKISDGSYSRFTFDMMLASDRPTSDDEESHTECVAKEKEESKIPITMPSEQDDDIPLFYSDIMPLLVDGERNIGEDAFVWLASLVPLTADIINGRFTFETLTAPTAYRLHYPAYDKFLKEIDKCIKHLQKQAMPKGVLELADDEYILHVEGTAGSQRVIRHIGGTSWPGRLTLTNYAVYFEASGVISYEDAIKLDLSKDIEHSVKPAATGPWGAPLFDKAIVYESPEWPEGIVLEFPEITSSTRRDHWLALIKEIILLHLFLSKFKIKSPIQAWEMHARTILGIVRLHAAREMLRLSPPAPTKFLIFALFEDLPKGDYVLEQLAESLKDVSSGHPCSASSILRNLNLYPSTISSIEVKEVGEEVISVSGQADSLSSLESTINQVREEAKEVEIAKATAETIKEEGHSESVLVLVELLSPLKSWFHWFQAVLTWERPAQTLIVIATTLLITYMEWIGKAIAAFLVWLVAKMLRARQEGIKDKCTEIVVCTASDQSTMESIVSAQQGLQTVHEMVQTANIAILKIRSILVYRAPKHVNTVIMVLAGSTIILAVVPFKYIIMGVTLYCFTTTSKLGKHRGQERGDRRLKEWWDSIPVIPVKVVDKVPDSPK